ncbi:amidohydrolase family protein [Phreatobacter stygius]|uniref:Amidohydrolase n=1 Tax=Phreatobacter stygius TaxID=1940610 RepID=A0A4D7AX64_9HYPH|nr:amidohydrolase family protein [Phreatobacter stygius]QCI64085.1 amidohydrolase [Phreatobacter stygius]
MTDTSLVSPEPTIPPPLAAPRRPHLRLPPGSCDSHCHVFGPHHRFPYAAGRSFTPHDMPEQRLRALHDHLGFDRAVIVQSACHGADHAALIDALRTGAGRYRGVALLGAAATATDVADLHEAGVRGARFNFLPHLGGYPPESLIRHVERLVAPHGWHFAVHVTGADLIACEELIRSIRVPVVIDHMARFDIREGRAGQAFATLLKLLEGSRISVKLSGVDRLSRQAAPYDDALPFARALAAHAPDQVVWGTDWPHPNLHGPMPDDGDLVDLIAGIAPDKAARHKLLVANPARLFGFN